MNDLNQNGGDGYKIIIPFLKAEENSILDGSGAAGGIGYGLGLAYDVSLVPGST